MAKFQETSNNFSIGSPIMESQREGFEEEEYAAVSSNGCNCFQALFNWPKSKNERQSLLNHNQNGMTASSEQKQSWFVTTLKDMKETSEKIAGPKWKTLIRKISWYRVKNNKRNYNGLFQYDPESYALNFDREDDDDDYSTRFVVPNTANPSQIR